MVRASTVACVLAAVAVAALPEALSAADRRPSADPGRLPQTSVLPSSSDARFRMRMAALWRGIVEDSPAAAMPALFPRSAYLQVKEIADPASDYRYRLLANYRADIHAVHRFLGSAVSAARLVAVRVPRQWAWITPGYCYNRIGYWHAPGARLIYKENGQIRSFGIFSLISWRGEWYVVHLARYDEPGTVDSPSPGIGSYGPPGGC